MSNSIDVPSTGDCAFCDYLWGRRSFTILARNPLSAILVTREQRGIGHLLIVPVSHRETLMDLSGAEGASIMTLLIAAGRALSDAFAPEGVAVWQNNGVPAHQAIPHVHFHVAGTRPAGGTDWGDVDELSIEDTDTIADEIRPYLTL